jgi:serine/threonine-protein kinase HipA
MPIKNQTINILEVLSSSSTPLLLSQINDRLRLGLNQKVLLRELNELIKSNRIAKDGHTNNAKYQMDEVLRYYKRFEFLYVHKDGEVAAYFIKLNDRYRFIYTTEFLMNLSKGIATIPLDIKKYDFNEIPPVFEENIPEGVNRDILEINSKKSDEFELLLKLEDNIGDLYFSKISETFSAGLAKGQTYLSLLPEILGTNEKIEVLSGFDIKLDDIYLFPENYDLTKLALKKADGISGFQYKKLVHIDFDTKEIIADEGVSKEYILKPYSKLKADPLNPHYFPHISINEHLFMSFAKNELHFRVPYSAIIQRECDDEFHYIVKRFDRYKTHRFSKNTFAPFLGLTSATKYDTSSEQIFKRIAREIISPKERMELLKHYVYSVIIVHEDMHTKNLSLIIEGDKILFAPLYDIACTGIYDTSKGFDTHISINGKQKNIRPNDFKALCTILNIKFIDFKKEAFKIASTYEAQLPLYIKELEKLGTIPFYKAKIKKKAGEPADWVRDKDAVEFTEVLSTFHAKQVQRLKSLGWIVCEKRNYNPSNRTGKDVLP